MIELKKEYIKDGQTVSGRLLANEDQVEALLKDKRITLVGPVRSEKPAKPAKE